MFCSPHLVVHGTASCPVCIQGQILHFHNFTLGSWDPENLPHSPLSELSQCWSASGGGGGCRAQRRPIQKPSQPELAASCCIAYYWGLERVTSHDMPQIRTDSMVPHVRHRDQHVSTSAHNVPPRHVQKYPHTYSCVFSLHSVA